LVFSLGLLLPSPTLVLPLPKGGGGFGEEKGGGGEKRNPPSPISFPSQREGEDLRGISSPSKRGRTKEGVSAVPPPQRGGGFRREFPFSLPFKGGLRGVSLLTLLF